MPIVYDPNPVKTDFELLITPIRMGTIVILAVWVTLHPVELPPWAIGSIVAATLYNITAVIITYKRNNKTLEIVSPLVHGFLSLIALYFTGGVTSPFEWVFTLTLACYSLRMPSRKALFFGLSFIAITIVAASFANTPASPLDYVSFAFSNISILVLLSSVVAVNSRHRNQLISTMAHELRTPMTIMKGNMHLARILLEKGKPMEDVIHRLRLADKELANLTTLLEKLQETLRDKEEIDHRKTPLEVTEEVEERLASYRMAGDGRRINWKPGDDPLWVMGSRHQIRIIVDNLMSNALKFSPPDGDVNVSLHKDGTKAHFTVTDSGQGIPREALKKVFDGFYRANHRSQDAPGGLGLGLYSVKQLVSLHGGEIWIDSTVGHGTSVHVLLPLIS